MRRIVFVLALPVLLAAEGGACESTAPPPLTRGGYAFTMIPTGDYYRGMPRLEVSTMGMVDGHTASDTLHCRGTITDDEWADLTGALNTARVLERGDSPDDCARLSAEQPTYAFCTDTTDGLHHCFRYVDCPAWPPVEEVRRLLFVAGTITNRLSVAGACGPDSYTYP